MDEAPQAQVRCVVWHPRGATMHPELDVALRRPGIRDVRCDSSLSAFAHLTTRQQPWSPRAAESSVLLLVEPTRLPDLLSVIEVVDRYNPGAAVWQFDPAAQPRLRAVGAEDICHWRSTLNRPTVQDTKALPREQGKASAVSRPSATPLLRLAGEGDLPPERSSLAADAPPHPYPDVKPTPPPVPTQPPAPQAGAESAPTLPSPSQHAEPTSATAPLLTEEELAMLLTEDADQHR